MKALISLLNALSKKSFGLLRNISLKNRGMVLSALKESLTLVFSSFSVMDFNVGLANVYFCLLIYGTLTLIY